MVLEDPSIKDQMADTTPAALAIAQMLEYNCIKHNREHPTTGLVTARHSAAQETPVPTYVGMMLHAHTRKRELVDMLSHLGMSISYTHVLELSAQMGNSACQQFHREQVVCSPKMRSNVFTTSAINNIDHDPSSTTAKWSFHGTAISILQHPSFTGEGMNRSIAIVGGSREASSKMVGRLPHDYTDVPPVTTNMKNISVPATSVVSLAFAMYLAALTELVPWFHALDHTHYARWIPVHLRDMAALPMKHPDVAREFGAGNFTVRKTKNVFSSIPIDQAHEQNNALIKGDGGAVGLTDNPSALLRWMIAGPEVARAIEEFRDGHQHWGRREDTRHHDQTPRVQTSFAKDVRALVRIIEELGNPFEEESMDLIDTKEMAGPAAVETVRNVKKVGQVQFQAFTRECLVERTKSINDAIRRNKLNMFNTSTPRSVSKGKQQLASLMNDVALFSRPYIGCQTRDGNLEEFFRHENQACPPALSNGESLRLGTKCDLLKCFEEFSSAQSEVPDSTCLVLDGAVIVQMMKLAVAKNFDDYAQNVFKPYLSPKLQTVSRLDLVWDRSIADSLKGRTRSKHGTGVRRPVVGAAAIPGNWQNFLRVDTNKTELFKFLSQAIFTWFDQDDKQLLITDGEAVMSKPPLLVLALLAPCSHEEADSRMLLHVSHAANHGHKILIKRVDTGVVVLAVSVAQGLLPEDELWLAFGTGKSFRYLAAHEIAAGLGPEKAQALPMCHALTGCDTASSFAGHGKKTAWTIWTVLPELTNALLKLSSAPSGIPDDVMHTIERFVILLYDRTSTCKEINKARKKIVAKKNNVQLIPPTKAALDEHVKRAAYQGGHVWGQTLLPTPELPSPSSWGWIKNDEGVYEPHWTKLPKAAHSCYELVSCKFKKRCVKRCKCKKAALECTALCVCVRGSAHTIERTQTEPTLSLI